MTSKLPTSQLGKNGPLIPRMGLGCMGLSIWYGSTPNSDEDRLKFLDGAHELGETFWVTSDRYGDNETLLGKWFKRTKLRSSIFLVTKFGFVPEDLTKSLLRTDPEYVKKACARSLKVLGVDKIDLYMAHRLDDKTPIEKTVEAMVELKKEGKIDYLGFSEISATSLRRACAVHQITAVEVEYSPFSLEIESEQINLLKTCRELGVAVIAYSPLGRGLLTGQIKSIDDLDANDVRRLYMPRFSLENFPKNLKLVEDIERIAEKKGVTPGQLSLAWLMAQGNDIFPIPGTKSVGRLEENLGALKMELTAEEIKEIRSVVDAAEVHGGRYPEAHASSCFKDTPALE